MVKFDNNYSILGRGLYTRQDKTNKYAHKKRREDIGTSEDNIFIFIAAEEIVLWRFGVAGEGDSIDRIPSDRRSYREREGKEVTIFCCYVDVSPNRFKTGRCGAEAYLDREE